jgi:hypothetical protein
MRRLIALLAAGTLLTSCSGTTAESTTTSSQPTTTSSLPATTTTAPATPTTTTAPGTTTTTISPATTTTFDSNQLASGSGCTPGTDVLPDGVWFGIVDSYDSNGIAFDLACWFSGDAAVIASAEDGEESPPPNDYYVRNQNPKLRHLDVAPDTPVRWFLSGDPNDYQDGTFTDWITFLDTIPFRLDIWVTIVNGNVASIEEQWVP